MLQQFKINSNAMKPTPNFNTSQTSSQRLKQINNLTQSSPYDINEFIIKKDTNSDNLNNINKN